MENKGLGPNEGQTTDRLGSSCSPTVEWLPIALAPRDGTEILVCGPYDEPCIVRWSGKNWIGSFQGEMALASQGDTWTDVHMAQVEEVLLWQPVPTAPDWSKDR